MFCLLWTMLKRPKLIPKSEYAEWAKNFDRLRHAAECAERREMLVRDELAAAEQKLCDLYAAMFPGIEHTEDTLETIDRIDRYVTAQATELASLRAKILESSDLRETTGAIHEVALELKESMAFILGQLPK